MTAILDPIEFTADTDGQSYNAVFEGFFDQSPNRCEIFLNGGKIGEATWYDDDGLIDRLPDSDGMPIKAWNEVCDRIEREVEYRIEGHKRASQLPSFVTSHEETLAYGQGSWIGPEHSYGAKIVTGYPVDADDTLVEGTFRHE
jgi:hypothetical protein